MVLFTTWRVDVLCSILSSVVFDETHSCAIGSAFVTSLVVYPSGAIAMNAFSWSRYRNCGNSCLDPRDQDEAKMDSKTTGIFSVPAAPTPAHNDDSGTRPRTLTTSIFASIVNLPLKNGRKSLILDWVTQSRKAQLKAQLCMWNARPYEQESVIGQFLTAMIESGAFFNCLTPSPKDAIDYHDKIKQYPN
ncbi:uncharacterized protein EV420DRAFT_1476071 [Desarmillaria tabescens]|uniref:Uncharacterized protein n=1 Tax=Armillaria tabescens TaxID=1929756 RepID=A0AA39NFH2_ARMTA|nr:uncharacterized protein EV420DRAFT_1476071 [Desarmillaria tabescens]KAK0464660.1 hypothetical protein EV420DRAFT_1476071 [Desarmillaria tabescens]